MSSPGPAGPGARPPRPDIGNQMITMMAFVFALIIMFDNNLRQGLGKIVGLGLEPIVGLQGHMPIVTLLLTGLLMSFFSIIVRHFFVDWVGQARSQRIA